MCVPRKMSIEADSFLNFLDEAVTYQVWLIPVLIYFWPTSVNQKRDDDYEIVLSESSLKDFIPS